MAASCLETTLILVFLAQYALSQIAFMVVPSDDHLRPQVVIEFIVVEQKPLGYWFPFYLMAKPERLLIGLWLHHILIILL
ncbi:hypothetical protein TorRG33x02_304660 [Trema orientale]|uniref:Secreted protein n=1 Tax=Trema orientale TaxID=63057 RepID=A0A2P5BXZ6_TREOI|nr:hypothetical protein TorRG33x02_304660 [Trema orientale]